MMTRVPSRVALNIAQLERAKFNEMVADGFYACAPETAKGSDRTFSRDEVVTLVMLARLIEHGISPRRAGQYACMAGGMAADHRMGPIHTVNIGSDAAGRASHWPNGIPPGHGPSLVGITINTDAIRDYVDSKVDWLGT